MKENLVKFCRELIKSKVTELKNALNDVLESSAAEIKSTAGDKHETGRAMMQLEQEKLGKQLQEAEGQLAEFEKIDFDLINNKIVLGSLIKTNKGWFLMAISIGKITIDSTTIFVISQKSPLGSALIGKKQKDTVVFNGVSYEILEIN